MTKLLNSPAICCGKLFFTSFFLLLVAASQTSFAQNIQVPGDQDMQNAFQAYRSNDMGALAQYANNDFGNHPLRHYPRAWYLESLLNGNGNLQNIDLAPYLAFFNQAQGEAVASELAKNLIKRAIAQEQYAAVLRFFPYVIAGDNNLQCQYQFARYRQGQALDSTVVRELWDKAEWLSEECNDLMQAAFITGSLSADLIWEKFRYSAESRNPQTALRIAGWFNSANDGASAATFNRLDNSPSAFLAATSPQSNLRPAREMRLAAVARLARITPPNAVLWLKDHRSEFNASELTYLQAVIASRATIEHFPEALALFTPVLQAPVAKNLGAWRVRSAIRVADWKTVLTTISALETTQQTKSEWVYWRGQALAKLGQKEDAQRYWRTTAGRDDYYSILCAEALGSGEYKLPRPLTIDTNLLNQWRNDVAVYRVNWLTNNNARRASFAEWQALVERVKKDPVALLAVAQIASDNNRPDLSIQAANLAFDQFGPAYNNVKLRYPTPHFDLLSKASDRINLNLPWVYGLMRQESRFIETAASGAGAQGLMQVMPATGHWMAGRLGETEYSLEWLREPGNNVHIGTNYMAHVLDELYDSIVLATAAYNAGPSRVKNWLANKALEGEVFIETIPIDETRDYVRKVIGNTIIYGALMSRPQGSIDKLIGQTPPLGLNQTPQ